MALSFTEKQLAQMMEDAAGDMRTFPQQPFTNYTGRVPDTGRAYQDIIASWCLDHWPLFESVAPIARELPYRDPLRDGTRPRRLSLAEEILSRDLYVRFHPGTGRRLHILGQVLDYQMPLGNRAADHAGKVDLVTWDGETLRLLALRTQSSTDSLLRCLLQSYVHLRTVDSSRLLADLRLPPDASVEAAPFVYLAGQQRQQTRDHAGVLGRLALRSGCRPIWYVP